MKKAKMRKPLSLFLSLVMLLSVTAGIDLSAFAETVSGKCGSNASWTFDTETGEVVISGTGPMVDNIYWSIRESNIKSVIINEGITSIGVNAFNNCQNMRSISIPDTVTSIGSSAFRYCYSLESIDLPDTLETIGDSAFYFASVIKELTIPKSVKTIGKQAFYGMRSLESIVIPDNITSISNSMFAECTALKDVTFPDNLTDIGTYAFDNCKSLKNIVIPDSVTSIGDDAFYMCYPEHVVLGDGLKDFNGFKFGYNYTTGAKNSYLKTIVIGNGITEIPWDVFDSCQDLIDVKIGKSVNSIENPFRGCYFLENITVDPENETYCSVDGILYSKDMSTLYRYPANKRATKYSMPTSVKNIAKEAFFECYSLTDIFYDGYESDWNEIAIDEDNYELFNYMTIHFKDSNIPYYEVVAHGASIRMIDKGLRFGFSFDEAQCDNVEEYGFVYSYRNGERLTANSFNVYEREAVNKTIDNGIVSFNLVFTNIPKSAFDNDVYVRAYVLIDDEYYYSPIIKRCFNDVANAVLNDDAVDEKIKQELVDILK